MTATGCIHKLLLCLGLLLALLVGAGTALAADPYDQGLTAFRRGDDNAALTLLLPFAEAGDAAAAFRVGEVRQRREPGDAGCSAALPWLQRAAAAGNGSALRRLGVMHETGCGVAANEEEARRLYAAALPILSEAAAGGDDQAQFDLARLYHFGSGMARQAEEARRWYQAAAERGHVAAQKNLASLYPAGSAEALHWTRQAAQAGDAAAQKQLAVFYATGSGVERDEPAAARWMARAAQQGFPPAEYLLGLAFAEGRGVPQDAAEAVVWLRRAAENGHPQAQFRLAEFYAAGRGVEPDVAAALLWLHRAADQGLPEARFELARRYAAGDGVGRDKAAALHWYRLAALHLAAASGDLAEAQRAVAAGALVDATDEEGATPLHRAVEAGQAEFALFLLEQGAAADVDDRSGVTPLMLAARRGEPALLQLLLAAGARADRRDAAGRGLLWYAAASPPAANIEGILLGYGAPYDKLLGAGSRSLGGQEYRKVTVHYATNRRVSGTLAEPDGYFGGDLDDALHFGTCEVAIPLRHLPGELEKPTIFSLNTFDPRRHVTLLGIAPQSEAEFFAGLRERQARGLGKRDLLVFMHGYNSSFSFAARRTAQLAFDLDFAGIPVFFSWPSANRLFAYGKDRERVEASIPQLKAFLLQLAERFEPENIHIVAHSMGTYGMSLALKEVAEELAQRERGPVFNQVVLAAADIDAKTFRRDIAPRIGKTAERVTLYASSRDFAMLVSRRFNDGVRAGDSAPEMTVVDGVESVDVSLADSSLLGHSYFAENRSVLGDLARVLRRETPLLRRLEERQAAPENRRFWFYNPLLAGGG